MIEGLYKSAWGALGSQIRQEAVANNMANVNTPGFRPDWVVMRSYRTRGELQSAAARPDRQALWQVGGGGMVAETRTAHRAGPVQRTGVNTDLAILADEGFFAIERDGQRRYTRAGNFRVNPQGELVTADGGWKVIGDGGPLVVGDANFSVDRDGAVTRIANGVPEVVGRVAVVGFEHPDRLLKAEGTAFSAPEGVEPQSARPEVRVQQGALEMSGTNAAQTLVNMIEAMRSYEANLNFVRIQDQLLGRAVTEIARLGG